MATDPAERFNKIFAKSARPELPDPSQPHIADLELAKPASIEQEVKQSQIPDVPQVACKFSQPDRSGARDIISSSEDEDDYVNAFKSAKPSILQKPEKNGGKRSRKATNGGLGKAQETQIELPGHLSDSPEDTISPSMRYPEDYETGKMPSLSKLPVHDVDGNKATGHFCVFSLVAKFPYRYMKDPSDKVSKHFFAYNKFYEREWDVYYLHPPESLYTQPIILLPAAQVQQLLNEISSAFKIDVKLPLAPFTMSFFDDRTPQPILLGRTKSRDRYNELASNIPSARQGHGECPKSASDQTRRAFEDYRSKIQDARAAGKKGKTTKKEQKAKARLVAVGEAHSGLRRIQRYFGLRPKSAGSIAPDPSLSWEEQQKWAEEQAQKTGAVLLSLNSAEPAPYALEKEVIFICFDVEANEHAHHLIMEVGVSTLDTRDIENIAPGPGGENWIKQIRSRHFRIQEHKHMRNKTFVSGNPDGFEFGQSEFVSLKSGEAVSAVDDCFLHPFSDGFQHDGSRDFKRSNHRESSGPANRRIILLGHDVQTDIDYLSKMGSKIFTASMAAYPPVAAHPVMNSIEEALDIAILYKALKNEDQPRSLGSVMTDLGRDPWGLHNGGNDARYTMECLVGLAIKARLEDDIKTKKAAEEKARLEAELDATNAAWAANTNIDPAPQLYNSTNTAEENAAIDAKFLDPEQTPASVRDAPAPGKGRHYGSDNELEDDSAGEDGWFGNLVQAADEKLKLSGGDDDDDSDFEM